MKRRNRRIKESKEGPIKAWFMGLLAAMVFAFPTAILIWLLTNRKLALYGPSNAYINGTGFWLIIGFFAFTATFFPRLYPSILGKIWRFIINYERNW